MDAPEKSDKPDAPRSVARRPDSAQRRPGLIGLVRDCRGATAVEYGFILALIVLAMIAALKDVGNTTSSMWNNINSKVSNAS